MSMSMSVSINLDRGYMGVHTYAAFSMLPCNFRDFRWHRVDWRLFPVPLWHLVSVRQILADRKALQHTKKYRQLCNSYYINAQRNNYYHIFHYFERFLNPDLNFKNKLIILLISRDCGIILKIIEFRKYILLETGFILKTENSLRLSAKFDILYFEIRVVTCGMKYNWQPSSCHKQ